MRCVEFGLGITLVVMGTLLLMTIPGLAEDGVNTIGPILMDLFIVFVGGVWIRHSFRGDDDVPS